MPLKVAIAEDLVVALAESKLTCGVSTRTTEVGQNRAKFHLNARDLKPVVRASRSCRRVRELQRHFTSVGWHGSNNPKALPRGS